MSPPKKNTLNVIAGMRYHDAPAAIDWLCRALGFEKEFGKNSVTVQCAGRPVESRRCKSATVKEELSTLPPSHVLGTARCPAKR